MSQEAKLQAAGARADASPSACYYGTPRLNLLALLAGRHPNRVLEIGCGHGANLVEIKRRTPGCHTTGVEIQAAAAEVARQQPAIDAVVEGDALDSGAVNFPADSFDLIVLSHVLEHFAQPERVLQRCLGWLDADGLVLIALPNLRHATVLLDLAWRGDFRYRADGILDRTHPRFYTRRSALRFLCDHGLAVCAIEADIQEGKSKLLDRCTFGLAREFSAFAYNFLATKAQPCT